MTETPDLSEQEIVAIASRDDDACYSAGGCDECGEPDYLGTGVIVDREQLATLCRMARRGARAALSAKLTNEALDNIVAACDYSYEGARRVALDALTAGAASSEEQ